LFVVAASTELPYPQQPFSSLFAGRRAAEQQQQQKQTQQQQTQQHQERNKLRTRGTHESPSKLQSQPGTLCVEADAGGRQRVYRTCSGVDKKSGKAWEGFDMVRYGG
jgi:hypothetical protein